jgi:hypothetical protein
VTDHSVCVLWQIDLIPVSTVLWAAAVSFIAMHCNPNAFEQSM